MTLGSIGKSIRDGGFSGVALVAFVALQYAGVNELAAGALALTASGFVTWLWRGIRNVWPAANRFDPLAKPHTS